MGVRGRHVASLWLRWSTRAADREVWPGSGQAGPEAPRLPRFPITAEGAEVWAGRFPHVGEAFPEALPAPLHLSSQ